MSLYDEVSTPYQLKKNLEIETGLIKSIGGAIETSIRIAHRMRRNCVLGDVSLEYDCDGYAHYSIIPSGEGTWFHDSKSQDYGNTHIDFMFVLNGVKNYIGDSGFSDYKVYLRKREKMTQEKGVFGIRMKEVPSGRLEYQIAIEVRWEITLDSTNTNLDVVVDEWPAMVEKKINERIASIEKMINADKRDLFFTILVCVAAVFFFIMCGALPTGWGLLGFLLLVVSIWLASAGVLSLSNLHKRFKANREALSYAKSESFRSKIERESYRWR